MSCPFRAGQARAQDSYRFRVFHDLLLGAANAPLFYFHPGRTHPIFNPGIMSRQIYYEASISSVGLWAAGVAVPFAGVFIRTADIILKSGSNTQVIPCPAVLSFLHRPAIYSVTISSLFPRTVPARLPSCAIPDTHGRRRSGFTAQRGRASETNSSEFVKLRHRIVSGPSPFLI